MVKLIGRPWLWWRGPLFWQVQFEMPPQVLHQLRIHSGNQLQRVITLQSSLQGKKEQLRDKHSTCLLFFFLKLKPCLCKIVFVWRHNIQMYDIHHQIWRNSTTSFLLIQDILHQLQCEMYDIHHQKNTTAAAKNKKSNLRLISQRWDQLQ